MKKTTTHFEDHFEQYLLSEKPHYSIKELNEDDRPREKLLAKGRAALSDAELLAIIIGSGSREDSALSLSRRILSSVQNQWNVLARLSISQLCKFKGIGEAKAISIVTALEIGKRRQAESPAEKVQFRSPQKVFSYIQSFLSHLSQEEFWVIYLDTKLNEIKKEQISKGGINNTIVDIRIVLKHALECGAVNLILTHNHPSGNIKPSQEDKAITKKLKKAADLLNIKVLDHIIITDQEYYSFSENGDL